MKKTLLLLLLAVPLFGQPKEPFSLEKLLASHPEWFGPVLAHPEKYRVQVLYTQIDRDAANRPHFRSYGYRVNADEYFYPASTVKLAACALALEKLNRLGILPSATMLTDTAGYGQTPASRDSTSPTGLPSVEHYIRKILLVSDNDAFNRLYEFIGQEAFNRRLQEVGLAGVRVVHRLSVFMKPGQNERTNPVRFLDAAGRELYRQPMLVNSQRPAPPAPILLGQGYETEDGRIIREPFDFTARNAFPIEAQQGLLKRLLFPQVFPEKQRFQLRKDDYRLLRQYMSQYPTESRSPAYDSTEFYPTYAKFLLYGSRRGAVPQPGVRIFNKIGNAYGFLIDNAYVVDLTTGVELLLTACILVNEDGIFNDGKYEYEAVGQPFMQHLGQALLAYEQQRPRPRRAKVSDFRMTYDQ